MARFYAWMQGARGRASRLGHANSGIRAEVKSWGGQVTVTMSVTREGTDWAYVTLSPHSDTHNAKALIVLYDGPCNGWQDYAGRGELGKMAWHTEHTRIAA